MPTITENKSVWDGKYGWSNRGDEWSASWGGPAMQWHGAILPRIQAYVPADRILEIACGYGRWTQFLKDLCRQLTVVELSEECLLACKARFADCTNIAYHVNDGKSLDMIPDSSIDFLFSFDSLVHVDYSVMQAYLSQLKRILTEDGVAFIHHSNLAEYCSRYSPIRSIPKIGRFLTTFANLETNLHWRDASVDARKVAELAKGNGLQCIQQEIINWGTRRMLIDCFSTIVKDTSALARDNRIIRNPRFMQEAQELLQQSQLNSACK